MQDNKQKKADAEKNIYKLFGKLHDCSKGLY